MTTRTSAPVADLPKRLPQLEASGAAVVVVRRVSSNGAPSNAHSPTFTSSTTPSSRHPSGAADGNATAGSAVTPRAEDEAAEALSQKGRRRPLGATHTRSRNARAF
ncbi:MAG: hypothetical protein AB1730_19135 [Myxococcota bacterium]|jgi:hypothetical protein